MNLHKNKLLLFALFSSLISFFVILYHGISLLLLLPLAFFLCFSLLMYDDIKKMKSLTLIIYSIISYVRYLILPIFESIYPITEISMYSQFTELNSAILMLVYEIIVVSIFFKIILKNAKEFRMKKIINKDYIVFENNTIIVILCAILILLILFSPSIVNNISLFVLSSNSDLRAGLIVKSGSLTEKILLQFFNNIKIFLIIIITNYFGKKYYKYKKRLYLLFPILLSVFIIGLIISDARSVFLYYGFPTIIIFLILYKKYRKKIIFNFLLIFTFLISMMSLYKTLYIFNSDSYIMGIMNSDFSLKDLGYQLEIYFLGPYSLEPCFHINANQSTLATVIYDFFRPFMGFNFIAKKLDLLTTSDMYCLLLTNGLSDTGYLLPITMQGYIYCGFLLAPLLLCLFLMIALKFEKILINSNKISIIFISGYIYIRLASCMIMSNSSTIITLISMMLIFTYLPLAFQKIINKRGKIIYE